MEDVPGWSRSQIHQIKAICTNTAVVPVPHLKGTTHKSCGRSSDKTEDDSEGYPRYLDEQFTMYFEDFQSLAAEVLWWKLLLQTKMQ